MPRLVLMQVSFHRPVTEHVVQRAMHRSRLFVASIWLLAVLCLCENRAALAQSANASSPQSAYPSLDSFADSSASNATRPSNGSSPGGRPKLDSGLQSDRLSSGLNETRKLELSRLFELQSQEAQSRDNSSASSLRPLVSRNDAANSSNLGVHVPIFFDLDKVSSDSRSDLAISVLGGLVTVSRNKTYSRGSSQGQTSVTVFGVPLYNSRPLE